MQQRCMCHTSTFMYLQKLINYPELWLLNLIFCVLLHLHSAAFSQQKYTALGKSADLALIYIIVPGWPSGKFSVLLRSPIHTGTTYKAVTIADTSKVRLILHPFNEDAAVEFHSN